MKTTKVKKVDFLPQVYVSKQNTIEVDLSTFYGRSITAQRATLLVDRNDGPKDDNFIAYATLQMGLTDNPELCELASSYVKPIRDVAIKVHSTGLTTTMCANVIGYNTVTFGFEPSDSVATMIFHVKSFNFDRHMVAYPNAGAEPSETVDVWASYRSQLHGKN